jgi:uncharacterized protein with PIN domain
MFIKFGDKTKKIIVKNSKEQSDKSDNQEENAIYLDSKDEENRRIKILNRYSSEDSEETNNKKLCNSKKNYTKSIKN